MENTSKPLTRNGNLGLGAVLVAVGGFIAVAVVLHPENANAPVWVVQAAGATFLLAGITLISQALNLPLLGKLAGLGVAYMLAVPGLWILFAGSGQGCSVSVALGGMTFDDAANAVMCRAAFGFGGLITVAFALLATWQALRRRKPRPLDDDPMRQAKVDRT